MMERPVEPLWRRFRALPRAFQWAGYAVLFFAIWYLWLAAGEWRATFESKADAIERHVQTVLDAPDLSAQLRRMRPIIASVGAVDMPQNVTSGSKALHNAVTDVLKKFSSVKNSEFNQRFDRRLPSSVLPELTGGAGRIEVYKGDLRFDATVDDATAIIAALESDPDIEMIKSLRMSKAGSGKVSVRLALEAWVLPDPQERTGRR
jgi:hypothetical protein